MALTDKTLTVVASQTAVAVIQLQMNTRDGMPIVTVQGASKDADGNAVGLTQAQGKLDRADPLLAPLLTLALKALQQANGLEDSDPVIASLDPAVALAQAQAQLAKAKVAVK